jgi:hypothetical protein
MYVEVHCTKIDDKEEEEEEDNGGTSVNNK